MAQNASHPISIDFLSFWGAAKLASAGASASAYDSAALHALQMKFAEFEPNTGMPFPYAPAFLLLILPFSYLPFPLAMAAWSLITLIVYAIIARRFSPESRWLAVSFPPVVAIAAVGQNGFITAACFIGGLLLLSRNQRFAAGLVLGCLIIKPQLALMLPIAMIAGANGGSSRDPLSQRSQCSFLVLLYLDLQHPRRGSTKPRSMLRSLGTDSSDGIKL